MLSQPLSGAGEFLPDDYYEEYLKIRSFMLDFRRKLSFKTLESVFSMLLNKQGMSVAVKDAFDEEMVAFQIENQIEIIRAQYQSINGSSILYGRRFDIFLKYRTSLTFMLKGFLLLKNQVTGCRQEIEDLTRDSTLRMEYPSRLPVLLNDLGEDSYACQSYQVIHALQTISESALRPVHCEHFSTKSLFLSTKMDDEAGNIFLCKTFKLIPTIYRQRKLKSLNQTMANSDPEDIQSQLKKYFPDFHSTFERIIDRAGVSMPDGLGVNDDDKYSATPAEQSDEKSFSLDAFKFIALETVFESSADQNKVKTEIETDYFSLLAKAKVLHNHYKDSPASLDTFSLEVFCIVAAQLPFKTCDDVELQQVHHNVYSDPIISELLQLWKPLQNLFERLDFLRKKYPENLVLLQIKQVAIKLSQLSFHERLMKFLTGVELLVNLLYSWERVAIKALTLAPEIDSLKVLIVRWRKLELNSWRALLDECHIHIKQETSLFLYDLLFQLIPSNANESYQGISVQTGFDLISQFMRTSMLGDFKVRLSILRRLHSLVNASLEIPLKCDISSLLHNLFFFYSQFQPSVEKRLQRVRRMSRKILKTSSV